jgi:hypothetical protein
MSLKHTLPTNQTRLFRIENTKGGEVAGTRIEGKEVWFARGPSCWMLQTFASYDDARRAVEFAFARAATEAEDHELSKLSQLSPSITATGYLARVGSQIGEFGVVEVQVRGIEGARYLVERNQRGFDTTIYPTLGEAEAAASRFAERTAIELSSDIPEEAQTTATPNMR